jgi:hypothetical protein
LRLFLGMAIARKPSTTIVDGGRARSTISGCGSPPRRRPPLLRAGGAVRRRDARLGERRAAARGVRERGRLVLDPEDDAPTEHAHVAFSAADDATVEVFHRTLIDVGYADNGAPGERLVYHVGYYGAFVLDPDANNIELVNHNRG